MPHASFCNPPLPKSKADLKEILAVALPEVYQPNAPDVEMVSTLGCELEVVVDEKMESKTCKGGALDGNSEVFEKTAVT